MVTRFQAATTTLLGTLLVLVSGCTTGDSADFASPPYQAEFEEARAKANDFQFAVLEDGHISDAEYLEAQDRYVSCMAERGITVFGGGLTEGFSQPYKANDVAGANAEDDCSNSSYGLFDSLYKDMRKNPEKKDFLEIYVQCLVEQDVAPFGFTSGDYETFIASLPAADQSKDFSEVIELDGGGVSVWFSPDAEHSDSMVIPGGKSLDSPEALECYDNPLGLTF
ncbi:hypothetical protein V5R04_05115 [Jonesiaceae bacterium BS-20]|uniref:Uncharacterized protein n=1 Tax=Jonesiaceae bacterium BS-20 TaxID=3120821 RepID=A0AAU7DY21_9MICO